MRQSAKTLRKSVLVALSILALSINEALSIEPGVLPNNWIDGTKCSDEPEVQVHSYSKNLFILRQSLCTNHEAPFIYLVFGENRVLMHDTGAGGISIRKVVDQIIKNWLDAQSRDAIELIVGHSHAHVDHVRGDTQFVGRQNTKIVGPTPGDVQSFFGIVNWPADIVEFDLGGGRIVDIIPIPGHEDAHVAFYDRLTGLLLTGDTLYPGRLYVPVDDYAEFVRSIERLAKFAESRNVQQILGGHIEMTERAGEDFELGAREHPNEHRLELSVDHLFELRDALRAMGNQPRREIHDEFIITPLGRGTGSAASLGARLAPVRPIILKSVEGLTGLKEMTPAEVREELNDPFSLLVLRDDPVLPATVEDVLAALDEHNGESRELPHQDVYVVSEAGQIPLDSSPIEPTRRARAVITRTKPGSSDSIVMIAPSTTGPLLELMAWDMKNRRFNFFERKKPRAWIWKGQSHHAMNPKARGKGCFRCHVNGAPVMKELRDPWANWHSQAASIQDEAIPPDSPLLTNPLFARANRIKAEQLERVIRAWAVRTNRQRIELLLQGRLSARSVLRPLFETTTVNLASSTEASRSGGESIPIPLGFFINAAAFSDAAEIDVAVLPPVSLVLYQESLDEFEFALTDDKTGFRQAGDTHFAFPVPVSADEDIDLVRQLVNRAVISDHLAACVLFVDFPNPIYSKQRQGLLALVPNKPLPEIGPGSLEQEFVAAIEARLSVLQDDNDERHALDQFLSCWRMTGSEWRTAITKRLTDYLAKVAASLRTRAGFFDYVKLAATRHLQFAASPHGHLKESSLLFPSSNALADVSDPENLRMTEEGTINN